MINLKNIFVSYNEKSIIEDLSLEFVTGGITSIIGPNGSGKSTILKSMARILKDYKGAISLNSKDIKTMKGKEVARILALLSQENKSPEDLTVEDLVYYGRMPHKGLLKMKNQEDIEIIQWALSKMKLLEKSNKKLSELSGGERQRAWIAMALSQKPKLLLLDEPTTYLDLAHQFELLQLVRDLNKTEGITVIMVLHDLNQAAKFSDHVVVLRAGKIYAKGTPEEVFTEIMAEEVYNLKVSLSRGLDGDIFINPIAVIG